MSGIVKASEKKVIFLTGFSEPDSLFEIEEQGDISLILLNNDRYLDLVEDDKWPTRVSAAIVHTTDAKPSGNFIQKNACLIEDSDLQRLLDGLEQGTPFILDQDIQDIANAPEESFTRKINIVLDFSHAMKESSFRVGASKQELPTEFFDKSIPILTASHGAMHVNFIDEKALSDEQKQHIESNTYVATLSPEVVSNGVTIGRNDTLSDFFSGMVKNAGFVRSAHIFGEFGDAKINVGRSISDEIQHDGMQQKYPFSVKRKTMGGDIDFHFWGNDKQGYQQQARTEELQGIVAKTYIIDPDKADVDLIVISTLSDDINYVDLNLDAVTPELADPSPRA